MYIKCSTRCISFCTILLCISLVQTQDIFDMFNDVKDQVVEKIDYASTKAKEKVRQHVLNLKEGETCPATHTTEYRTVLTAYRQLVKDWISKFPSKNAKDYRMTLHISPNELDRLTKFASASSYEEQQVLHEVHVISDLLKRIVEKIEEDTSVYSTMTWSAWIRSFDINMIIKTILALIAIGAISFISIRTHLRRGRWFTTFFIVTFIVSVIQNWYTLYQEAQAKVDKVLMKKVPKHCQGHSMGIFDMIKSKLGRFVQIPVDECLEYHMALRAAPYSQVTPVQAMSMTFAQLFLTPLGAIGEGISKFFAGTMLHVPIFLWPIIIVLVLIILIIILLMYSRYEVHLPFMMGSIRPSPRTALPSTNTNDDVQQIENAGVRTQQIESKQQQNSQLEHKPTTTTRPSRTSSIERIDESRQRSQSRSRVNASAQEENDLRQRTTSPEIGFRKDLLSNDS